MKNKKMSWDFYKSSGYAPVIKHRDISNPTANNVVWTPLASMRIVICSLTVSSNLGGTIAFFFGGNQQVKLAELSMGSSFTLAPEIEGWESTAIDAPLYAVASSGGTNGWKVTAEGFELE
jgi:hypothetical protein